VSEPALSVVCLAGPDRRRTRRMVDALAAQTALGSIELVLVDAGSPADLPGAPEGLGVTVVPLPEGATLGGARAAGLRVARGYVAVAFILDHCYPGPQWAEALLEAYRGPWAAVGFAFACDAPATYGARAAKIADHGPFLEGTRGGRAESLSFTEVSYRRGFLDGLGDLSRVLDCEFFAEERIRDERLEIWVEPEAVVVHENLSTVLLNARASYNWSRLVGGRQFRGARLGMARRLLYALLSPLAVPVLRTVRLVRDTRDTVARRELATALPAIIVKNIAEGLGQAHGYLFGEGAAAQRVVVNELYPPRGGCR
jgi:hypothetical protein